MGAVREVLLVAVVVAALVITWSSTSSSCQGLPRSVISSSPTDIDATSMTQGRIGKHESQSANAGERAVPRRGERSPLRVALCFFGLLKAVDEEHLFVLNLSVVHPLRSAGYDVHAFLHTYDATQFRNPFNRESFTRTFNQTESLRMLRRLFLDRQLDVVTEPAESTADVFFPLGAYLSAGDPWPFNANVSLKYFLRQQYSLLRVTEMWTGCRISTTTTVGMPASGELRLTSDDAAQRLHRCRLRDDEYDAVMYLRPDLYFFSELNTAGFDAVAGSALVHRRRARLNGNDVVRCPIHPWIRQEETLAESPSSLSSPPLFRMAAVSSAPPPPLPLDIAVPVFEWGGLHDRVAFGGAEVMALYGTRGLALRHYVEKLGKKPHAEKYLRDYLCAAEVRVHLVPLFSGRARVSGLLDDDGAVKLRQRYLDWRVAGWAKWQRNQALDAYGRGNRKSCIMESVWAVKPFVDDTSIRKARFRK